MLQLRLDLNTETKEINNLKCGDEFFISEIWRNCYKKQITVTLTKKNYLPKDNKNDIKNLLTFGDDEYKIIKIFDDPTRNEKNILIRKIDSIDSINFEVTVK